MLADYNKPEFWFNFFINIFIDLEATDEAHLYATC